MEKVILQKLHNNQDLEEIISSQFDTEWVAPKLYQKIKEMIIEDFIHGNCEYDYNHEFNIHFYDNVDFNVYVDITIPLSIYNEVAEYCEIEYYYSQSYEDYNYEILRYIYNKYVNDRYNKNIVEIFENSAKDALDEYLCDDLITIVMELLYR